MTYKAQCPKCKRVRMTTESIDVVARWLSAGLIVSALSEDVSAADDKCQFCGGKK